MYCVHYNQLFSNFIVVSFQLEEPEEPKMLTPEEQLADKLRLKKLQEESDLELAKETFGKWGCVTVQY